MTDFLCTFCMSYSHAPPECNHNPARRCISCGGAVGYRFVADDGRPSSPWKCPRCQR